MQNQLQASESECREAKERESALSVKLSESQQQCRLLEESSRYEKLEVDRLSEEVSRVNELLQLEKQTTQSLELSLKRERSLSIQFQSRITSLQRTIDDLQQRLRVGDIRASNA